MAPFVERLHATCRAHPNIVEIVPLIGDGKTVVGYRSNGLPTSLIQVVTKAGNKESAEHFLSTVLSTAEDRIGELVFRGEALLGFVAREIAPVFVSSPVATAVVAAVTSAVGVAAPLPGIALPQLHGLADAAAAATILHGRAD